MTTRFLAISMMGLALASISSRAQAQPWTPAAAAYATDDYRAPYADAQRAAFDNGYRTGLKRGTQAVRDRRPLEIERERDYRSADEGYNRSFGDRNRYRDAFRGGFAAGYRDGYSPRGARAPFPTAGRDYGRGYGGTANFGARQNGISDGYEKGLEDVKDRKNSDVSRHKWFRNGDHEFDDRYGPKESYRVEYRRGFEEGYHRAYREARRY